MDIIQFVETLGFPVAAVCGLGIVFYKVLIKSFNEKHEQMYGITVDLIKASQQVRESIKGLEVQLKTITEFVKDRK
tara:strand:+ start:162 stop:389 length:228 start_codon:yes stop_codon:yes gene_type:complete